MTMIPHRAAWRGLTTKTYGKFSNIHHSRKLSFRKYFGYPHGNVSLSVFQMLQLGGEKLFLRKINVTLAWVTVHET